jgi:ribonuclease HII
MSSSSYRGTVRRRKLCGVTGVVARRAAERRAEVMLRRERALWARGISRVAGIDEAGRGPLAGPVVAAAVVMPREFFLPRVDDSKRLSPPVRRELAALILQGAVSVGIGVVDHQVIDRINILNATFEAMHRAVENLTVVPEFLLVDGNRYRGGNIPYATIVEGDALCFSIAAASIIAKVTRDRMMEEYDVHFPVYGFARHKGYATHAHRLAILRYGICPIHRRTFTRNLVAELLDENAVDIREGPPGGDACPRTS